MQPKWTGAHARLSVHVFGMLNRAMGEQRPNWESTTPKSLLRATHIWYIMPAQLHLPNGRIKGKFRFAMVESSDLFLLLPSLMAYTTQGGVR